LSTDDREGSTAQHRLHAEDPVPVLSEAIFGAGAEGACVFLDGVPGEHRIFRWVLIMPYGGRRLYYVR
jgi:hypothetical protein